MRALPMTVAVLIAAPAVAGEPAHPPPPTGRQAPSIELWSGVDFEQGDYGTGQKVRRVSVPATVKLRSKRLELAATIPYTRVEAPSNVVAGTGLLGLPIIVDPTQPASGRKRGAGLGDATLSAAYRVPTAVVDFRASAEAKLPTAKRGLGTGKPDYAVGVQASRTVGAITPFVGAGYTMPGDPSGVALRNSVSVTGGVAARLGAETQGFAAYGRGQSANKALPDEQQVTAGITTSVSNSLALGVYGSAGLSKGSADAGAGIRLGIPIR